MDSHLYLPKGAFLAQSKRSDIDIFPDAKKVKKCVKYKCYYIYYI